MCVRMLQRLLKKSKPNKNQRTWKQRTIIQTNDLASTPGSNRHRIAELCMPSACGHVIRTPGSWASGLGGADNESIYLRCQNHQLDRGSCDAMTRPMTTPDLDTFKSVHIRSVPLRWARRSVGRSSPLQGEGPGFESQRVHR